MDSVAFSALLLAPGIVLGAFVAHQLVFCLLSVIAMLRTRPIPADGQEVRFVVVVPAHDEETLIGGTVRSILGVDYPPERIDLIVIADNCSDATAQAARGAGARCLERTDVLRRGKPFALDWLVSQLDLDRYDALVIVDADTHVHRDFFKQMAAHLHCGQRALQGYFGVLNPDQTWLTRLSLMPAALKFRLHFPGKELAGLSCPLAGNGMCFDIDIIRRFGWKAFSLTENWEYWAQLALNDIRVGVAADAVIYSQVANSLASGKSQRIRWMKGRIDTLRRYGGRLLAAGLRQPSAMKLDALIELLRPSYALLFLWSVVYVAVMLPLAVKTGEYLAPAVLGMTVLAAQVVCFLVAFLWDRPPLRAWLALLMVPWYLAWKLLISLGGLLTLRDRAWIKTRRND